MGMPVTGNRLMFRQKRIQRHVLRIIEMHLAERPISQIARATGVSRSSVYRVISDIMDNQPKASGGNQP